MSCYAGPEISEGGLVLCLDAANLKSYPGSGTSITDVSNNLNNGTFTNVTVSSNSMNFNGSSSFVTIANSSTLDPRRTFSIDVWFYALALPATWINIINKADTSQSAATRTYGIWLNSSGYVYFDTGNGTVNTQLSTSAGSITINNWYNYCVCINRTAGTCTTYLNTIVQNNVSNVSQTDTVSTTNPVYIGGRYAFNFFNGSIPLVKFYNRALSAEEVRQNFNALRGRFGL